MKCRYNTVLFDFDGTIADTGSGVKNSIRYALGSYGIPVGDEKKLDSFIGPPLYESFERVYGVSQEESIKLVNEYRVYYAKQGVYELEVYSGILDLLNELKASGVKTAVASSKPKHFLDVVIPYIKADALFDTVVGPELTSNNSDKSTLIRTALFELGESAGNHVAMIGDRFYDVEAALSTGVTPIGVLFGYGSKDELEGAGASLIAQNVAELEKLLSK